MSDKREPTERKRRTIGEGAETPSDTEKEATDGDLVFDGIGNTRGVKGFDTNNPGVNGETPILEQPTVTTDAHSARWQNHEEYLKEVVPILAILRIWLRRYIFDAATRDDLIQDMALKLWQRAPERGDQIDNLVGWSLVVLKHNVHAEWRKNSKRSYTSLPTNITAGENITQAEVERRENEIQVRAAMARLSTEEREILTLKVHDGMKSDEIATLLHITSFTARKRIERALDHLAEQLGLDFPKKTEC